MSTSTKTSTPNWARMRYRNGHVYVVFDRFSLRHQGEKLREAGFEWRPKDKDWRAHRTPEAIEAAETMLHANNVEYWVEKRGCSLPDSLKNGQEKVKTIQEPSNGKKAVERTREPQNGNGNLGSSKDALEFLTATKAVFKEAVREVLREEGIVATRSF